MTAATASSVPPLHRVRQSAVAIDADGADFDQPAGTAAPVLKGKKINS
jgi:hypothetical protein